MSRKYVLLLLAFGWAIGDWLVGNSIGTFVSQMTSAGFALLMHWSLSK